MKLNLIRMLRAIRRFNKIRQVFVIWRKFLYEKSYETAKISLMDGVYRINNFSKSVCYPKRDAFRKTSNVCLIH